MVLTQKETTLLNDLKTQEQMCIDKYERCAADACDRTLGALFWDIGLVERGHLNTIERMLDGAEPPLPAGDTQKPQDDFRAHPAYTALSDGEDKNSDQYLCRDALSMEKHISALYDTAIFEFTQASLRDVLNHIQKEEQQHGKRICDYMAANGMCS